jgi:hypothetical protein
MHERVSKVLPSALKQQMEVEMTATLLNRRQALIGFAASLAIISIAAPRIAFAASALKQFAPKGDGAFEHGAFDSVLAGAVSIDAAGYAAVNYSAVVGNRAALDGYVASLEAFDPTTLGKAEAHAFWINLYNAKTLSLMAERWPVKSIKDIKLGGGGIFGKGPWSKKIMTVNGEPLSLDDVEHRIVRALFRDPLSHYALNCASYSCPNLMPKSYTGKNLKSLMAESAKLYVNHPRGLTVSDGKITASKIYDWYADDFGGEGKLKAHWAKYAAPELAASLEAASIDDYVYDWNANVAR